MFLVFRRWYLGEGKEDNKFINKGKECRMRDVWVLYCRDLRERVRLVRVILDFLGKVVFEGLNEFLDLGNRVSKRLLSIGVCRLGGYGFFVIGIRL